MGVPVTVMAAMPAGWSSVRMDSGSGAGTQVAANAVMAAAANVAMGMVIRTVLVAPC